MNYRKPEEEKAFFAKFSFTKAIKDRDAIKDDLYTYFRRFSKTYKAIVEYITKAKEECVLIEKTGPILMARGTGPCISYRSCHMYSDDYSSKKVNGLAVPIPSPVFCLSISVRMVDSDDVECGMEDPREFERNFDIQVPLDLEQNFTQKKFDAWIKEKKRIVNEKQAGIDRKELARLVKKYPNHAASLLMKNETTNANA